MAPTRALLLLCILSCATAYLFPQRNEPLSFANIQDEPCFFQPPAVTLELPLPKPLQDAFSKAEIALKELMADNKSCLAPGMSASAVYKDKVIWTFNLGEKDTTTKLPPDGDTLFRIGSVTKIFPTLLLYQAASDPNIDLSLDDPVAKQVPSFKIQDPFGASSALTWRALASQMSGLPREAPCSFINCDGPTEVILKRLSEQRVISPQWRRPSYSNLAFSLLGHLIAEKVYDTDFESMLAQNITNKLGMRDTGNDFTPSVRARMATGYDANGDPVELYDLGWSRPAGQMYSSTNDLAKLASMFLKSGSNTNTPVLDGDWLAEMMQPIFINQDGSSGFGTPWELDFTNNYWNKQKGGSITGFVSMFNVIQELQLGYSVLFNGPCDTNRATDVFMSNVIPALVKVLKGLVTLPPQPPNPNRYEGTYTNGALVANLPDTGLIIKIETFSLYLSWFSGDDFQLYAEYNLYGSCMIGELLGFNGQWVIFKEDQGVMSFQIQGLFGDTVFTKQS